LRDCPFHSLELSFHTLSHSSVERTNEENPGRSPAFLSMRCPHLVRRSIRPHTGGHQEHIDRFRVAFVRWSQ
jgi:hypothetical protein